jgi:hypothetical protein
MIKKALRLLTVPGARFMFRETLFGDVEHIKRPVSPGR